MKLDLGNYAQRKIMPFKNTEGDVCTFQEYLRSHNLFASHCYMYPMYTSKKEEDRISPSVSQEKEACSQLKLSGQAESVQSGVSDVFMGLGLHRAKVFSIAFCYKLHCLNKPQTLNEELEAFDRLEMVSPSPIFVRENNILWKSTTFPHQRMYKTSHCLSLHF